MENTLKYDDAVLVIKSAILQSQYDAARSVNEKQLMLYYGIGKYISLNSRKGFWGKGAIDAISERLQKELPGLRGFSARSLRDMRIFYEEWAMLDNSNVPIEMAETCGDGNLAPTGAKLEIKKWHPVVPKSIDISDISFFAIGFTLHRTILSKVKNIDARIFYIKRCAAEKYSRENLEASIARDDYHHQGNLPNNFCKLQRGFFELYAKFLILPQVEAKLNTEDISPPQDRMEPLGRGSVGFAERPHDRRFRISELSHNV